MDFDKLESSPAMKIGGSCSIELGNRRRNSETEKEAFSEEPSGCVEQTSSIGALRTNRNQTQLGQKASRALLQRVFSGRMKLLTHRPTHAHRPRERSKTTQNVNQQRKIETIGAGSGRKGHTPVSGASGGRRQLGSKCGEGQVASATAAANAAKWDSECKDVFVRLRPVNWKKGNLLSRSNGRGSH